MKDTTRQQAVVKKPPSARKNKSRKKIAVAAPKEQSTLERRRFEQLFYRLSTFFLAADSSQLDSKIEKGLADAAGYFRADRASLWEFSLDGQKVNPTHSFVQPGLEPPATILLQTTFLHPGTLERPENPTSPAVASQSTLAAMETLPLRKAEDKYFFWPFHSWWPALCAVS